MNPLFLLWCEFPSTRIMKDHIKKPSGDFFLPTYSSYARSLLLYWCRCSGNIFIWKKLANKLRVHTMQLNCCIMLLSHWRVICFGYWKILSQASVQRHKKILKMLVAREMQRSIFHCLSDDLYAGGTKFFVFFKLQMRSRLCIVLLSIHQEILSTGIKTE